MLVLCLFKKLLNGFFEGHLVELDEATTFGDFTTRFQRLVVCLLSLMSAGSHCARIRAVCTQLWIPLTVLCSVSGFMVSTTVGVTSTLFDVTPFPMIQREAATTSAGVTKVWRKIIACDFISMHANDFEE